MVKVPWAAWAGYESATEEARGMIVKYIGYNGGAFDIKFCPEVGSTQLLKGIHGLSSALRRGACSA